MMISFVIPCYRSEKNITSVVNEIKETVTKRSGCKYEIIAVNDQSPDNVYSVLKSLAAADKQVKVIDLSKNMGKHAALMAGFRHACGDYIAICDDDGQCPIEHLWELIDAVDEGYDAAMANYGVKAQSRFKNFGSRMNDWMMRTLLNKPRHIKFANFAVFRPFVVSEMLKYKNPYPYVNGLLLQATHKIKNVPMEERERLNGTGGYTFKKSFSLWMNGFTAFSVKPLRIATALGAVLALAGFAFGIYVIIRKLVHPNILAGYSSLFAAMLFIGGVIMLMMGLIGEYIGRIYISINNAPQYVVRETINIANHNLIPENRRNEKN